MPRVCRRSSCSSNHTVWYDSTAGLVNHWPSPARTPSERDRESWPVPVEAGHLVAEPGAHRLDPAVDRGRHVDDAGVVARVGVVVERAVGLDLPVGAHLDEVRVDREELVVGGADDILARQRTPARRRGALDGPRAHPASGTIPRRGPPCGRGVRPRRRPAAVRRLPVRRQRPLPRLTPCRATARHAE